MRNAVVLLNLGAPDGPEAIRPFLQNLFSDPAILRVPWIIRSVLARLIAARRTPEAKKIYGRIGGKSPLLENTRKQAEALKEALKPHGDWEVFIAMRYWRPRAEETVNMLSAYNPDTVILLPLYPQFSTTTTASSFKDIQKELRRAGIKAEIKAPCCYPVHPDFIAALANPLREALKNAGNCAETRILFSAHGLPKKIVEAGDPYAWQVEKTAEAVMVKLREMRGGDALEYRVCYQSRVGPLEWIGPDTEAEIRRAGGEKKSLIVIPVAFVSEHSETLVELDMEYAKIAAESGVVSYTRLPTPGVDALFIRALASLCLSDKRERICPREMCGCATA